MAAAAILDFPIVLIFNSRNCQGGRTAPACQILWKSVEPRPIYGDFSIFQDGGRCHNEFSKFQDFNGRDVQEGRIASACQILSKSVEPRLRYAYFQIFQDGGRRHLGFSKFKIFNSLNGQGLGF